MATNRRCSACMHQQRSSIDADLLAGRSLREVARRYNLSKDAAHRHMEHIDPEERTEVVQQSGLTASSVAARIKNIADDARATRIALQGRSEYRAALRASEVELRTLDALATRLGISDLDVVEQTRMMQAVQSALAHSLHRRPEIADDIAASLRADGFSDIADTVEQYAAKQTPTPATDSEEAHRGIETE